MSNLLLIYLIAPQSWHVHVVDAISAMQCHVIFTHALLDNYACFSSPPRAQGLSEKVQGSQWKLIVTY